jgi:protein-disulfide isomerase
LVALGGKSDGWEPPSALLARGHVKVDPHGARGGLEVDMAVLHDHRARLSCLPPYVGVTVNAMRTLLTATLVFLAACSASTSSVGAATDAALPAPVTVEVGDAPSQGPATAKVVVVEFGDFQCPYCGEEEPIVTQMLAAYAGRIRFVFKEFPLAQHQYAELAAEAALAANAQGKFWPYHDMLYANQDALARANLDAYAMTLGLDMTKFDDALDAGTFAPAVAADIAQGESLGVDGTPTFFVNGIVVAGAVPYSDLESIINRELAANP